MLPEENQIWQVSTSQSSMRCLCSTVWEYQQYTYLTNKDWPRRDKHLRQNNPGRNGERSRLGDKESDDSIIISPPGIRILKEG